MQEDQFTKRAANVIQIVQMGGTESVTQVALVLKDVYGLACEDVAEMFLDAANKAVQEGKVEMYQFFQSQVRMVRLLKTGKKDI